MTPKFYILKEEGTETVKHFITPEPQELKDALNSIQWGMSRGIVSLMNPIRTVTTYWEI